MSQGMAGEVEHFKPGMAEVYYPAVAHGFMRFTKLIAPLVQRQVARKVHPNVLAPHGAYKPLPGTQIRKVGFMGHNFRLWKVAVVPIVVNMVMGADNKVDMFAA